MSARFKAIVRGLLDHVPPLARRFLIRRSYAQEGEDRLLLRYFGLKRDGFYVDVGAHHPFRYSNTQLFYEMGWRGVNIDAMPGSMTPFRRVRRRDVNLEIGVGEQPASLSFFIFDEAALNTFDENVAHKYETEGNVIKRVVHVGVERLADILERHLPVGQKIDLLTIDVEGRDLEVLRSNDWSRFRPSVILAEAIGKSLDDLADDPSTAFLRSVGYIPYAKTVNTFVFVEGET